MTALDGWENFYVIVGSSAGALIGLQFVVLALIPGKVRAGGFGPQQQGGASRLRETGADENSVLGRLRTAGGCKGLPGDVSAAAFW